MQEKRETDREKKKEDSYPKPLILLTMKVKCVVWCTWKRARQRKRQNTTWSNPACKLLLEKWMFDLSCPPLMEVMIKRATDREWQTHRTDITKQPLSLSAFRIVRVSSFMASADRGIDWERKRMQPCRSSRCAASLTASLCWCSNRLHTCISMSVCVRLCVCETVPSLFSPLIQAAFSFFCCSCWALTLLHALPDLCWQDK